MTAWALCAIGYTSAGSRGFIIARHYAAALTVFAAAAFVPPPWMLVPIGSLLSGPVSPRRLWAKSPRRRAALHQGIGRMKRRLYQKAVFRRAKTLLSERKALEDGLQSLFARPKTLLRDLETVLRDAKRFGRDLQALLRGFRALCPHLQSLEGGLKALWAYWCGPLTYRYTFSAKEWDC